MVGWQKFDAVGSVLLLMVTPGVPATVGYRRPLLPNWLLGKFSKVSVTGSICPGRIVTAGHNPTVGLLKGEAREAAERSAGSMGMKVLIIVPEESPLVWRVPW